MASSNFWTTAPRIMNSLVNSFVGMVPWTSLQKAIFQHGQTFPPGFEGGLPTRVYCEFPTLAAQATDDIVMGLPSNFVLLGYSKFSVDVVTPSNPEPTFRVQIYDVGAEYDLVPGKAINGGNVGGNLGRILFERQPYTFKGSDPQCEVRISNLSLVEADIQFALYGLQGVNP
jgi:hypothetical protein